jgi:signal transduction histidine kinase/ligand-binding sensor domain-containing protein/DNA-binding response OmpR family regulator
MTKSQSIKIIIIIIGQLLLFQSTLFASLKFERFSNNEGFNQNTIIAIEQDGHGFLWFGTPNGLIKYDGYSFYNYTHDSDNKNSISNNNVECLFVDIEGNLWIGTREDVNVYIPRLDKFFKVPIGANKLITSIKSDAKGQIWISGQNVFFTCKLAYSGNDILFEFSDNLIKAIPSPSIIREFCFINDENVLCSNGEGLFRLELEFSSSDKNPRIKSIHNYSVLSELQISAIHKTDNMFWIGTGSGLYKTFLDGDRLHIMQKFEMKTIDNRSNSEMNILSIFEDKSGVLWIGSGNEGIFKSNTEKDIFENFGFDPKNNKGISSPRINCFFQDSFGVLWIGTAQGGVNKLDVTQKLFYNYSNNPYDKTSIANNLIMDILEDNKGRLWLSSYDGSISKSIDPVDSTNAGNLRFEEIKSQIPLDKNEFITCMYQDKKNFIWLGTDQSCVVYNPVNNLFKKVEFVQNGEKTPISLCRFIGQLEPNSILLGGEKIFVVQNPWIKIQNEKNPLLELSTTFNGLGVIQTSIKDKNGYYWFGAENGLFQCNYRDNKFNILNHYSTNGENNFKLSHNYIFSLLEDNFGNIWVGTFGGGLNKLGFNQSGNLLKIETFRKNKLLPDDAVYGILQEDEKFIWISTDMGLCRLDISKNELITFDMRDGLPQNNFRQSAYCKGKTGYYYFGGLNGLVVFNPENIKFNYVSPNPVITGISIDNKPVSIGEKIEGKVLLEVSTFETKNITLSQKTKTVTFHVAVQNYTTPSKNRLAYKLEGFNNDWIEAGRGISSITYTNLPSGNYILRIKGTNGDGVWGNDTTDLSVIILPPWYRTGWGYTIFFLSFLGIFVVVFIYFIRLEKLKQRLKYEQIDKQRINNINQGKLQFFTNISHEFRTPLTLIVGPLEKVIERNNDEQNNKYLTTIQNNTRRLLSLIDQLITFRKAEQGYLNLNLTSNTLGNFIYPTTEAFEGYAIQKNINFYYKINSPNEEVVIDVEKTERILYNLLSNSFRHTPPNGNISIETDVVWLSGKKMISFKVIDSGIGIPADKLDKIFEQFYQLEDRKENVGGTGIGLAYCKTLIDLMGGTITVKSELNVSTCFTILMPSKSIGEITQGKSAKNVQSFIKDWIPEKNPHSHVLSGNLENYPKKYSLLIVEDETDVQNFLINELSEKYSIVLAENGVDGWNKIAQNEPDLVISDVLMPEMNGFELCEKIKSTTETCHIPIILLTALGDKEDVKKGFEFWADDYISKPFSPRHLLIRVEKLIENRHRLRDYFTKRSSMPDNDIEISNRDKLFLTEVINAIEKNLSNSNFGVQELANEIQLSPSQFYRRLKQLTGQIPNVYIRNYRLQRAAELLKSNEGFNVAEVMYHIGIESNSYFSTSFKKLYSISPSEFIRKNHA